MDFKAEFDVLNFYNIKSDGYAECKLCNRRMRNLNTKVLKEHLLQAHIIESDVAKYFKYIDGMQVAECRECNRRIWHTQRNSLERHAQRYHNIKIRYLKNPIFMNALVTSQNGVVSSTGDESIEILDTKTNEYQGMNYEKNCEGQSVEHDNELKTEDFQCDGKYGPMTEEILSIGMDKKILQSAVWGLMIDDGVAPSLFGSKNMQSLIKPICDVISETEDKECKLDNEVSERILRSVANQLRNNFSNDLHSRLLSLKIDMDFKGREKTYCVSVSFVREGRIQKRILGVIDLEDDPQLTEQHIKQVLNKYNIDSNQIIYACWDDTKSKYNTTVSNSEYLKEIEKFENHPVIHFNGMKIERYVGVFAHLCLLDILKNHKIFDLISSCRNFVKFISNEANGFVKILKENEISVPQLDSPWKWGSTYKMMDELREARKILETEIYPKMELVEDRLDINENFWFFIDAFCESLRPLQKSINIFYTEEIHLGDFYTQWSKNKIMTRRLPLKNLIINNYLRLLTSEAMKCIERRTNEVLAIDALQACLYLDPRFQHTLSADMMSTAIEFLKKTWDLSQMYNSDVEESRRECMQLPKFNDEENDLLNKFLCQDLQETKSGTASVHEKIEQLRLQCKPVGTNILLFWKNQKTTEPEIFYLSEICFAIPATQNYNQRRYTHIYKTQPNRKLPQPTMDNLATIRLNPHLVDDVSKWFDTNEENSHVDDN